MVNGIVHVCTNAEGIYHLSDLVGHVLVDSRFDKIRNDALGALNVADVLMLASSIKDVTIIIMGKGSDAVVVSVKKVAFATLQILVVIDILDNWGVTDLAKHSLKIGIGFCPLISGTLVVCCVLEITTSAQSLIKGEKDKKEDILAIAGATAKMSEQVLVLLACTQPGLILALAATSSACGVVKVFSSGV